VTLLPGKVFAGAAAVANKDGVLLARHGLFESGLIMATTIMPRNLIRQVRQDYSSGKFSFPLFLCEASRVLDGTASKSNT
jgi:hypothetical protein